MPAGREIIPGRDCLVDDGVELAEDENARAGIADDNVAAIGDHGAIALHADAGPKLFADVDRRAVRDLRVIAIYDDAGAAVAYREGAGIHYCRTIALHVDRYGKSPALMAAPAELTIVLSSLIAKIPAAGPAVAPMAIAPAFVTVLLPATKIPLPLSRTVMIPVAALVTVLFTPAKIPGQMIRPPACRCW
jgi:hypothetical protein